MGTEIQKIKTLSDVGETPFQVIERQENILQGWDNKKRRSIYLFKTESGVWGYYDKASKQTINISAWKDKSAFVDGNWVKMSLYHRVHVKFAQVVNSNSWDYHNKKRVSVPLTEAIITLTDSAYKSLEEQANGRPLESWFKLSFVTQKKKTGGSMTYANKVIWVS
jgi:hypothetical protein